MLVCGGGNDGLMPQSLEHLEILNLLGVKSVIVALTKCDLVDEATINLRKKEIRDEISKFKNLQILEIFAVSIRIRKASMSLETTSLR